MVTPLFISKFKFPSGNQPIGKVWLKIYVQFYFGGMTLSDALASFNEEQLLDLSQLLTATKFRLVHGIVMKKIINKVALNLNSVIALHQNGRRKQLILLGPRENYIVVPEYEAYRKAQKRLLR